MSINGVGANGAGPEKINAKKVGEEAGKGGFVGGLKNAIGNLLNGGSKADTIDQPIKGLSIEYTADHTVVTGAADYARGDDRGMVDYSGTGTISYSGTTGYTGGEAGYGSTLDYTATGTVGYGGTVDYAVNVTHDDYENGQQVGTTDYIGGGEVSGMVDYTATGTVGYARGDDHGMVDYSGAGTISYSGTTGYTGGEAGYGSTVDYTATGTVGYGGTVDYMEP